MSHYYPTRLKYPPNHPFKLYILEANNVCSGCGYTDSYIKIGYTGDDPEKRRASMQTGCPLPISLVRVINVKDGLNEEKRLHEYLKGLHTAGEWFRHTGEVLSGLNLLGEDL